MASDIQTLTGNTLKPEFDQKLIADFHNTFKKTFHIKWNPVYKKDLGLVGVNYNFFKILVNRVKRFNESYDIMIVGGRGIGKSAFGLSSAIILYRLFEGNKNAKFPVANICFSVEEWSDRCKELKGKGGVVILDEIGTSGSLSSRESMSKENRSTADLIQLMRTDKVITIYISVDTGRIDKRVRSLTSVLASPIRKLSDADTGMGKMIECDIKIRRTSPGSQKEIKRSGKQTDAEYLHHIIMPPQYSPKGWIHSIVVPHPDEMIWKKYEAKREVRLEEIRTTSEGISRSNSKKKDVASEVKDIVNSKLKEKA